MALTNQQNRYRVDEGEVQGGLDDWMNTYGDMVTLLMAFFVIIVSVSTIDPAKFAELAAGVKQQLTKEETITPLNQIKKSLDSLLAEEQRNKMVTIDLNRDGIVMKFASSAFYTSGSAKVGKDAKAIIDKVAEALRNITRYPFAVDIEGHTDNVPIKSVRFPSNWELSVQRATNIVKYMISIGLDAQRLKAAGYSDTKPVLPNLDSLTQKPIPDNQSANRRIVIRIH